MEGHFLVEEGICRWTDTDKQGWRVSGTGLQIDPAPNPGPTHDKDSHFIMFQPPHSSYQTGWHVLMVKCTGSHSLVWRLAFGLKEGAKVGHKMLDPEGASWNPRSHLHVEKGLGQGHKTSHCKASS